MEGLIRLPGDKRNHLISGTKRVIVNGEYVLELYSAKFIIGSSAGRVDVTSLVVPHHLPMKTLCYGHLNNKRSTTSFSLSGNSLRGFELGLSVVLV